MISLEEFKSLSETSQRTLTEFCAKAESFRNTMTDELVSSVVYSMQGYINLLSKFKSSEYLLEKRPWEYENSVKELKGKTNLYRDMLEYIQKKFVYTVSKTTRCSRKISYVGKVSIAQMNDFFVLAESALQMIAEDVSRYKKLKTDLRAYSLIDEINQAIKNLKLYSETIFRVDLGSIYAQKDYRMYVDSYREKTVNYLEVYIRIKKFENVTDYYD